MNLQKIAALVLVGIFSLSMVATAVIGSQSEPIRPTLMSAEEAYRECGGIAERDTRFEDTGDGTMAAVELYLCPDGSSILAMR